MPPDVDDYMDSVDRLMIRLEKDAALNKRESDAIRRDLTRDIRNIGATGTSAMSVTRLGSAKVLVPSSKNLAKVNLTSSQVRERFSTFRLNYLSKKDIKELLDGPLSEIDKARFVRQSKRLAQNAKDFLREIEELEPSLAEEARETRRQIDDSANDLLKLEVRSWTRMEENLMRSVGGRQTRTTATEIARSWDVNRSVWNLSLLEHPKAVTRSLLARSSEKMAQRVSKTISEIPRRAFVLVGAGPDTIKEMKPGSRTASLIWRIFSAKDLDSRFARAATKGLAFSTWRNLGLAFATSEWYVPIPPELAEEVEQIMRKRRSDLLGDLRESVSDLSPTAVT